MEPAAIPLVMVGAFICGDISKDLLRFIKENKLGKVLPYQVQSGYGKYSAVAFDLEKLKAFDPKGVAEFRKEWNLPDKKPVKKKNRGMEPVSYTHLDVYKRQV